MAASILGDVFPELRQPGEARTPPLFAPRLCEPQIALAALLGLARLRAVRGAAHHLGAPFWPTA